MVTQNRAFPAQSQKRQPGLQKPMVPQPSVKGEWYKGSGKLEGKVALITGGDSGIGQSVAIFFAREGADIAINYLNEHEDAKQAQKDVEAEGRKCILIPGDISNSKICTKVVDQTIKEFGKIDILVNNAAFQGEQSELETLDDAKLEKTFKTNIFSFFYMSREALKHLPDNEGIIINTASITAYRGNAHLLDYSSTKGAIVSFTRSLSSAIVKRGIRVNAVAPGPIWTPLTPSTYSPEEVSEFGTKTAMGRAGHPEEVAGAYVFLAARDSSYITGQVIHPNGGDPVTS
jgi:NAD(P)-dependent dehydrogenase (short-subunit alcohol dehydrogenase family)